MIIFFYTLLFIYILLIGFVIFTFINFRQEMNKKNFKIASKFSIIIPFKNEENNLLFLLNSLNNLNYTTENFEVIFIDDASTDSGPELIKTYDKKFSCQVIFNQRKSNSPKKDALETGIKEAKYEFIITTDADCILPENWLKSYDQFIQKNNPQMVAGPVTYIDKDGFLYKFQTLEFLVLQAFTQTGFALKKPFLANGANLCFRKDSFFKVKAYEGNNHLASGDDVFLLEKISKSFPEDIYFLKDQQNIVKTFPLNNLRGIFNQKIRWASKISIQNNSFASVLALFLVVVHLIQLFALFGWYFNPVFFFIFLFIKFFCDLVLFLIISKFYLNKISIKDILLSEFAYPFYMMIIIFKVFKGKYEWKGNKYF